MHRTYAPLFLILILFVACQTPALEPQEKAAEAQWQGFKAGRTSLMEVGWCVHGQYDGDPAAAWMIPKDGTYVLQRQYVNLSGCHVPQLLRRELAR